MLTCLLLFMILSSGSVFVTTFFNRKYEETVPLTIFSIIFILFFSGVFGFLNLGVYIIYVISLLLYFLSIFKYIKTKKDNNVLQNTFTPAFFIYAFTFLLLFWGNYNRVACNWDEFSHWADIVKAMYTINDFGTNPLSNSLFKSYPPAMALFQYFIQKLNGGFSEWLLYFSYQIISFSLFIPFLKDLKHKDIKKNLLIYILILIIVSIFYTDFYNSILIDAFLGILFGFIFSIMFINDGYDHLNTITIVLAISAISIVKDVGMLFAIISLLVFIIDIIFYKQNENYSYKNSFYKPVIVLIATSLLVITKILWKNNLTKNNVQISFSSKIKYTEFIKILIGKGSIDSTSFYRINVFKNYIHNLCVYEIKIGNFGFNNIQILLILFVALYIVYSLFGKLDEKNIKRNRFFMYSAIINTIIYIIGLAATYMYNFSEYEALAVASFQRYMNIILTMILIFVFILMLNIFIKTKTYKNIILKMIFVIVLSAPYISLFNFIHRDNVQQSIAIRYPYVEIVEKANTLIDKKHSKIYVISQEDKGLDLLVLKYNLRPAQINDKEWSIGVPFYEGDIWTSDLNAKKWQNTLLTENYDYVLIYRLNDYFVENYKYNFKNTKDIGENKLYRLNKDTGLLELVEIK
ncbi:MAG: hypothetical protein GX675_02375 [Erysipelotrichaceae bacterium]|nr:hypothetical protein [Erysipelotrichaceae bacterium]